MTSVRLSVVVAALIALPALVAVIQPAGGESSIVTWDGDKAISGTERYAKCTIELGGNLNISGTLTFMGVELVVKSPMDLTRKITVMGGGTFNVLERSIIRSSDPDIHFLFHIDPNGAMEMKDSELHDCGADPFFGIPYIEPDPNFGLFIESGGGLVSITNCTLSNNYAGIIVAGGSSPAITDSNISGNEWAGIEVWGTSSPVILRNRICANGFGLFDAGCSRSSGNVYSGNRDGVALGTGSAARFSNDTMSNNTESGVTGDSLNQPFSARMVGCRFVGNARDVVFDRFMMGGRGGELVFENTTHDPAAVHVSDAGCVLVVEWYLDINVVYQSSGKPVVGASVNLTDSTGALAVHNITGPGGRLERLCLEEYRAFDVFKAWKSPYSVSVKDGHLSNETAGITLNRSLRLEIVMDDLPPQLMVLSHQNGSLVNEEATLFYGLTEPGASLTVNGKAATVQGNGSWSIEMGLENEGANLITVKAVDKAGNWAQVELTVYRDTMPSLLKVWSPVDGLVTNKLTVRVAGSTNDTGALVTVNGRPVDVGEDGSFNMTVDLSEGDNIIVVECRDAASNSVTVSRTVTRDTIAPVLSVQTPLTGMVTGLSKTLAKGIVEEGAFFTINGMTFGSAGGAFEVLLELQEGENYFTFEARDRAGNINKTMVLVIRDCTSPLLVVLCPDDGSRLNRSLVEVRGRSEAGASVTVNGMDVALDGSNFNTTVTLPNEGKNTIVIEAVDASGNRAMSTITAYLDTTAPAIQLVEPPNNTLTNQSSMLLVGKTEPGAFVQAAGGQMIVDKNGTFSGRIPLEKEGQNIIKLAVRDDLFNTAEATLTIWRDTEVVFNISLPKEGERVRAKSIAISGVVEAGASLVVAGKAVACGPDGSFSAVVPLETGPNMVSLTITDAAGNVAELSVNVTRIGTVSEEPADSPVPILVIVAVAVAAGIAVAAWRFRKRA